MKRISLLVALSLAFALTAEEASENDIKRRNQYRRELVELESKRDALKEKIRSQLESAETLTVTAELMEGLRKFPPVERERVSELKSFEVDVARALDKNATDKANCVHRWLMLDEGHRYRFYAEVRAEYVDGTNIKFGLMVPRRGERTDWPSASVGCGSFEWRSVTFDYLMPSGASSVLLLYGLEGGSGHVEFRNVVVSELVSVLE